MKKEKLTIVSLKVESFVTETSDRIMGGVKETTNCTQPTTDVQGTCGYKTTEPKTCVDTYNWCWTP
ncbi:MAG: hypothetical protein WBB45_01030 [Cyclobacteriaceae bacterium]